MNQTIQARAVQGGKQVNTFSQAYGQANIHTDRQAARQAGAHQPKCKHPHIEQYIHTYIATYW